MSEHIPLELYKQIHASLPIPCVDAVILNTNKEVLLCHRLNKPAQGTWWFPGGRVLKGETMEDAILRKVKQETNLDVDIVKQLGTDQTMFPDGPFDGETHTINTVFIVTPKNGGDLAVDNQSDELQWFNKIPKNSAAYIKKYIKLALI